VKIKIPYGDSYQELEINQNNLAEILKAKEIKPVKDERLAIEKSLDFPIKSKKLEKIVKTNDKVVIVINDKTRPAPSRILIEAISKRLNLSGVPDSNIQIIIATGTHNANTQEETEKIVGKEVFERFHIENHNCLDQNNLKYIGHTGRIPVYINRKVAEADIKILTGVILPHHAAGFGGGRKSVIPGVASLETLKLHHSFPIRSFDPVMGKIEGNIFHEEAIKAARMVAVDFIVNVVQNDQKETVAVVAGDLEAAFQEGVNISRDMCEVFYSKNPDIVITSPGGFPRDINLYQSQKAIDPAEIIMNKSGIIILVAECRYPLENNEFSHWMKQATSPYEVIERFKKEGFTIGSAKAFMFARALTKHKIFVVTENMSYKELREMFLLKFNHIQDALSKALNIMGENSRVTVLPNGNNLIPKKGGGNNL